MMLPDDEARKKWTDHWINKGLAGNLIFLTNNLAFEEVLKTTRGKYCVGDEVSFADLVLVPQLFFCEFVKIDTTVYPNITEIAANLAVLPEFIAASPPSCPDFKPHP